MKRIFLFLVPILLCACSTTRHVQMQVAERISKDTIYLSNVHYDSIYVLQDKYTDCSRDTIYIKDKSIEYRYKLLRDTIRIVQCDSIPYIVRITEVKEVKHIPPWIKSIVGLSMAIILFACYPIFKKLIIR